LFKSEVDRKHFTSSEAKFMYNSIDSTKFFKIDSSRIIVRVFKKTIYDRIHQRNGLDLMYDELERIYGSSEFLMISTPIFDSTYTKAIISVDLHCGSLCGQGNEFILEKQRGIWRIITVYYTWES
jgi:hypothetical protein